MFLLHMLVTLVLSSLQLCSCNEWCTNLANNTALIKEAILKDYVNWTLPESLPGKEKVEIIIKMRIRTIVALHALNQTLHTTVFMSESWVDKRLTWDRFKYGNCSQIIVDRRLIWNPTLELVETVMNSEKDHSFESVIGAHVHSDGNVTYSYPAVFVTACSMDMYYFPYDRHQCSLSFKPVGGEEGLVTVNIPNREVGIEFYTLNNAWELTHIRSNPSNESVTSSTNETSSVVVFTLYVRRYANVYFYFLYYPNSIFNFLSCMQFLIPSNHSARKVTLGVGIIVMLFMYLILLTSSLPMSDNVPILLTFLSITFGLVATSLVMAIVIIDVHYKSFHFKDCEMPAWVRRIFLQKLSWLLLLKFEDEDYRRYKLNDSSGSMDSFYDSSIYDMFNKARRNSGGGQSGSTKASSLKGVFSYRKAKKRGRRFSIPSVGTCSLSGTGQVYPVKHPPDVHPETGEAQNGSDTPVHAVTLPQDSDASMNNNASNKNNNSDEPEPQRRSSLPGQQRRLSSTGQRPASAGMYRSASVDQPSSAGQQRPSVTSWTSGVQRSSSLPASRHRRSSLIESYFTAEMLKAQVQPPPQQEPQSEHEEEILTLIIHHLHHLAMLRKKKRDHLHIRCDWQRMSAVINRALLIVYMISIGIMWYSIYSVDREELESTEGLQKISIGRNFDDLAETLGPGVSILG